MSTIEYNFRLDFKPALQQITFLKKVLETFYIAITLKMD